MPLQRKGPVLFVEWLLVIGFIAVITGLVYMAVNDDSTTLTFTVDNDAPQTSLSFPAILGDDKGRTVPAMVVVNPEDVPKLAQGGPWKVLIDTDDPRWNLEE
jgi:hypothetical protein